VEIEVTAIIPLARGKDPHRPPADARGRTP
jgi:hypothetical protein